MAAIERGGVAATVPFVGRRAELATLSALFARARRENRPAVALVTGEAGSGKSRLIAESLRRMDARRTAMAAGLEPNQTIPLAAVAPLIRRLGVVPEDGPRLERLVFGTDGLASRGLLQVFEAAQRARTAFGPLALVIDDLQWLDAASLGLVAYLIAAAETETGAFVVIATARPSPAAAEFAATFRGRVAADRTFVSELGPLDLDDGLALVRAIDPSIDPTAAERLWRRSAGSPFWLEVLARGEARGRPASPLEERLRSLSADGAALIAALAVAARPLSSTDAARVLDWPRERLDQAVRELESRGLAGASGIGAIGVAHDLIREMVGKSISESARRRLRADLVAVIEASAGDDLSLLMEALDHGIAAGLPATALALRVATSPHRRLLDRIALSRLATVVDSLPAGSEDRPVLVEALARLAGEIGLHETAMRTWSEVAVAARGDEARGRAELEAARAASALGWAQEAHAHLARARTASTDPLTTLLVDSLEVDVALWYDHDGPWGAAVAARAMAGARRIIAEAGGQAELSTEAREVVLGAIVAAADAALQEDRGADVIEITTLAAEIAQSLDEEARLWAGLRIGFQVRAIGHVRAALDHYRAAWVASRQLALPTAMVEAGRGLASSLRSVGHLEEASSVAVEIVGLEERLGRLAPRWGTSLPILHRIELSLDRPGALGRLRDDAARERDPHFAIALHQLIALYLARRDGASRLAEVELELAAAEDASAAARCRRCARELLVVGAEVLARIGQIERAHDALTAWEEDSTGRTYVMRELWRTRARTAIALAEGGAPTHELSQLGAAFDEVGYVEESAWAYLDLGGALVRAGRRVDAREAYERVASPASGPAAPAVTPLARRRLRELGVRVPRPGPGALGEQRFEGLSPREHEVASLVATGASNREIAEALAISPKTVERHLTNILTKLGARNRTEIARIVLAGRTAGRRPDSSAGTGFPR